MNKPLIAILLFSLSLTAQAADGILGAAGNDRCGLGTMIWGSRESISTQSSEEATNLAFSNGPLSITTGTSGCTNSGFVQVPQKELFYANMNFEELTVEMASGRGETLAGLAQTMGCDAEYMGLFLETTKSEYPSVYSSPEITPYNMIVNLRSRLRANSTLSRGCRSLRS